jgi:hypothetical protein
VSGFAEWCPGVNREFEWRLEVWWRDYSSSIWNIAGAAMVSGIFFLARGGSASPSLDGRGGRRHMSRGDRQFGKVTVNTDLYRGDLDFGVVAHFVLADWTAALSGVEDGGVGSGQADFS